MVSRFTLPDLPDGSPAGPNLELDAAFGELERTARGKPESQYGNTIEPATAPDWAETAVQAEALLGRTRDLRVMVLLAIARLHLEGLPGYAGVLGLIRQHLETLWEHVHPQLDPEDDNDPLQRTNVLRPLEDPVRVLRPMRDLPLASIPKTGPVSWRDIAILNGALEPEPGRKRLVEAAVHDAFAGTAPARLTALREAAESVLADLAAISAIFAPLGTSDRALDFEDLIKLVRDIRKDLVRYQPPDAEAAEPEAVTAAVPGDAAPDRPARSVRGGASLQSITTLGSRDEALHALELAAAYFRANEPSSPLPLLIDRAKRLAAMPFLDILRDLAPEGLLQAQTVVGMTEEE